MQNEKILIDIGFTELEARVYLFILHNEVVTASRIYKKLGLDKSSVYRILENLQTQKYIDSTKNNYGQQYFVLDPNLLVEKAEGIYKHQQGVFEKVSQFVEDIQDDPSSYHQQQNIQIYVGEDSYLKLREKQLTSLPDEIKEISSVQILNQSLEKYYDYIETFHERRESKNIVLKRLLEDSKNMPNDPARYDQLFYKKLIKKISPQMLISIFGDFTAFLKYNDREAIVVIHYDPLLSGTFSDIFDYLWEVSEIKPGN